MTRWQSGQAIQSALHIVHDDPDEAATLFRIAVAVADNAQAGLDLRRFSAQLPGDGKAIENRLSRLAPLLHCNPQWSDWGDRDLGGLRIFAKIEEAYAVYLVRPQLMRATSVHCTRYTGGLLKRLP